MTGKSGLIIGTLTIFLVGSGHGPPHNRPGTGTDRPSAWPAATAAADWQQGSPRTGSRQQEAQGPGPPQRMEGPGGRPLQPRLPRPRHPGLG